MNATLTGKVTCGIVVSDGPKVLLGHAARSPRWDIPKGVAEPGEAFIDAAIRELREETSLVADADELTALGVHDYLPAKRIALFSWRLDALPDPSQLVCSSMIPVGKSWIPEFDRFGLFDWAEVYERVGKNLARVLAELQKSGSASA
ncbi:MAG TPA: NUDIX hydrolase [Alphaproteobacteria bacterium]|jgi:8-oxo-dGTP pyrophosphatase MutT (NUDIX family)|nr:NUDIX hydrolase [Alphaproteobacteria bacterium]